MDTAGRPTCPICLTCGTQFPSMADLPAHCPICDDERQYVGWDGQRWTSMEALAAGHRIRFEAHHGVAMLGLDPGFAINQRAFLIPSAGKHIMWECLSLVTQDAVDQISALGGVSAIAISHPHFYSAMVDWSEALGGVPIYLHAADRQWVQRPSASIVFWEGERLALSDDVSLLRLGGHFPGSTGLHVRNFPRDGGGLFPGDAIQVVLDRRFTSFMYSYPNAIPMKPGDLQHIRQVVESLQFDDVYGFTWGREIIGGGRDAVLRSMDRYARQLAA